MRLDPALAACGGDSNEPKELQLRDIAGNWQGTAFEITDLETGEKAEYLSKGYLAEFDMTVSAAGALAFSAREPDEDEADVSTGTIALDGNNVTITLDAEVYHGTIATGDRTLTINLLSDELRQVLVFRRR